MYHRRRGAREDALSSPRLAEILPYWAYDAARASSFYDELRRQIQEVMGDVAGLSVMQDAGQPTPVMRRWCLDVAADLMDAWVRSHGTGLSDPPHLRVDACRERSDAFIAFSTAFPISLFALAVGAQVRLVVHYGWATLLTLLPVVAAAPARPIYRWFVFRAIEEWVNGQNAMSRIFWALHRAKPRP